MTKPIHYSEKFKRLYKRKIKTKRKLKRIFDVQLEKFKVSSEHPDLRSHYLENKKRSLGGYRAFSITDDIRIIYKEEKDFYYFIDIGTHKEVYGEGY